MTRISMQTLVDHIRDGGLADSSAARKMVGATLAVLANRLTDDEASALASRFSPELARIIEEEDYDADFDAAELYERVRDRTGTPPGLAREHTDIVLRALGDVLDEPMLARLARVLPEPIVRGLQGPERVEVPPHGAGAKPRHTRTIATGRPGSSHPISESAPPSGHTHSVALSDNPHAETKLSSARGLTQERFDETIATGRPPQSS